MSFVCDTCGKSFEVHRYLKDHIRKVHKKKKIQCFVCKKLLARRSTLNNHLRVKHPEEQCPDKVPDNQNQQFLSGQLQADTRVVCNICSKSFTRQSTLTAHLREVHNSVNPKSDTCHCPQCGVPCFTTKAVIEHLASKHFINVVQEEIEFSTFDEFLEWKLETEKETISYYLLKRKVDNQSETVHFYPCNRSGYSEIKSKRDNNPNSKTSQKESVKINAICPASMTTFENRNNGHTMVKYIKTHVGHRDDPSKLPISQADRELIKEKYRNNIPPTVILKEFRQFPINSPLRYISKSNIRRIGKLAKSSVTVVKF